MIAAMMIERWLMLRWLKEPVRSTLSSREFLDTALAYAGARRSAGLRIRGNVSAIATAPRPSAAEPR